MKREFIGAIPPVVMTLFYGVAWFMETRGMLEPETINRLQMIGVIVTLLVIGWMIGWVVCRELFRRPNRLLGIELSASLKRTNDFLDQCKERLKESDPCPK